MHPYLAEFIGTFLLILLGCGVNANVNLTGTKGHGAGWLVIAVGWGLGVYVGLFCVGDISGGHLNPAVTLGLAVAGKFAAAKIPGYVIAQMLGAIFGASVVWLIHKPHFDRTQDADAKLGTFATGPAIRNLPISLVCEAVATFVLVFGVLSITKPSMTLADQSVPFGLGSVGALPVALLVTAVGTCLGGPTGWAINPARDLGPRIAHALLPIPGKRDSDWGYAWIPVVGPALGAVIAALLFGFVAVAE